MVDGGAPEPVPDTAMDTESDEGDPGTGDTRPLTDDEQALLARLRDGSRTAAGPAAEESAQYAAAVDADSPVPGTAPTAGSDRLDPVFREPDS